MGAWLSFESTDGGEEGGAWGTGRAGEKGRGTEGTAVLLTKTLMFPAPFHDVLPPPNGQVPSPPQFPDGRRGL